MKKSFEQRRRVTRLLFAVIAAIIFAVIVGFVALIFAVIAYPESVGIFFSKIYKGFTI